MFKSNPPAGNNPPELICTTPVYVAPPSTTVPPEYVLLPANTNVGLFTGENTKRVFAPYPLSAITEFTVVVA
jgi:hypothetical protein